LIEICDDIRILLVRSIDRIDGLRAEAVEHRLDEARIQNSRALSSLKSMPT